jgi:hypothetical protein
MRADDFTCAQMRPYSYSDSNAHTNANAIDSSVPAAPDPEPPVPLPELVGPVYPTVGSATHWQANRSDVEAWQVAYPTLDIPDQMQRASVWLAANMGRRKRPGGMKRFLVNWFNRSVDRGGGTGGRVPSMFDESPEQFADRVMAQEAQRDKR